MISACTVPWWAPVSHWSLPDKHVISAWWALWCNFLSIRRSYVFYKSLHTACSNIFLIKHARTHTHKIIYTKRKAYLFFISNNWLLSTDLSSSSWKKTHTEKKVQFITSPQRGWFLILQVTFPRSSEAKATGFPERQWEKTKCTSPYGLNPSPLHSKGGVSTTGPPGKSHSY